MQPAHCTVRACFGLTLAAAAAAPLGACGDDTCQKAAEVRAAGMQRACAERDDGCCACKCWREGADQGELEGSECVCLYVSATTDGCTGPALESAETCLRDEDACAEAVRRGVFASCP